MSDTIRCYSCFGQGMWPPKGTGYIYAAVAPSACKKCNGTGKIIVSSVCSNCFGQGSWPPVDIEGEIYPEILPSECKVCKGSGLPS